MTVRVSTIGALLLNALIAHGPSTSKQLSAHCGVSNRQVLHTLKNLRVGGFATQLQGVHSITGAGRAWRPDAPSVSTRAAEPGDAGEPGVAGSRRFVSTLPYAAQAVVYRPGALDADHVPSRMFGRLRFRDGSEADLFATTLKPTPATELTT